MPKDAKGHGSNSRGGGEKGHADHFADSQKLLKQRVELLKAGKHAEAADAMAKAKEHASMAKHLLISERRRANGQTPAQKMARDPEAAKPINKRGDTFKPKDDGPRIPSKSDPAIAQRAKAVSEQRDNPRGGMTKRRK